MIRALCATLLAGALLVGANPATAADTTTSPGAPVGNVTPTTQPKRGVAVVAQSAPVDGEVALLVDNGSRRPVRIERLTAIATSNGGALATLARTKKVYPQVVAPDQLALAAVKFRRRALTASARITVKVRSHRVTAARAARVLRVGDVVVSPPQTGPVAQTLRATLTNGQRRWTARRPEAAVVCFGEAGTPTTFAAARASVRRIAPGRSAAASIDLTLLCPTYLVAARAS